MKRWLFHIAATISLLLFLATGALWVRSYYVWESVHRDTWSSSDRIHTAHTLSIVWGRVRAAYSRLDPLDNDSVYDAAGPNWYHNATLAWNNHEPPWQFYNKLSREGRMQEIAAPAWVIALAFAVLPAAWIVRRYRTRRLRRTGHCFSCGYDLRASPDRCPECGVMPLKH